MPQPTNPNKFARIGQDVTIWPLAKIISPETISLGDSIIIDDFVFLAGGRRTVIGSFVHIAAFALIVGGGEFIIEDFSGISGGVKVYTGNDDYLGGCLTGPTVPYPYRVPIRSFVHLHKHAIIGANSVVLPGVTIGEGAVVGANCLVTRDCEPWTLYVGSPAKPLRLRPKEKILELEARLRQEIYDAEGRYVPKILRGCPSPRADIIEAEC
jgi:acetyltransferase-like isoleucine patch superfamily enzyme